MTEEVEIKLAKCISELCRLGFSVTVNEIFELVAEYLTANNIIVSKFKNNKPGKDWLNCFMNRHRLSLKKAEMMCLARKSATANPFIIFDFYEILENIISSKNLSAKQIWNCDESAFSSDPASCKVVGVKGKAAYRITSGPGRENTTVLAACNAAGRALPPLVIFAGQNLQSSWRGDKALEGTTYGISPSGWMTSEVFSSWFDHFVSIVKERPLLLVLDGHITHTSLSVIEKAINEDVTILKLPPHSTDLLQPLDVACFAPLKKLWIKKLNLWLNQWGPRLPVRKHNLVNLLGEIWEQGLTPNNIMAGFSATGVYPVDKTKYPADRLDGRLVRRYNSWVAAGKPDDVEIDLTTSISTPQKFNARKETPVTTVQPLNSEVPENTNVEIQRSVNYKKCTDLETSMPTTQPPPGKMWAAVWALVDVPPISTPTQMETSFEDLVLSKMKAPPPPPKDQPVRRRCDLKSKVVTGDEYLNAIKEANDRGMKRKLPAAKKVKAKPAKSSKQNIRFLVNDSPSSSSSELSELSADEEDEIPASVNSKDENLPQTSSTVSMVQSLIKEIGQVTKSLDDDKINCYYAVYYGSSKYYWGKVLKCFSFDSDSDVDKLEMSFLHYRGDGLYDYPKVKDVETIESRFVFLGPSPVQVVLGKGIAIEADEAAKQRFYHINKYRYYN